MKMLEESLKRAPIVKKGDYNYVVHPITDGIPMIEPEILREVTDKMEKHLREAGEIDRIVTIEAMGIPLAAALSLKTGIPFTIIRKREYGLPGEISVEQMTGYSKSKLFINGLKKGDKVVIVDDVLSTGGTLKAVLDAFKEVGVEVKAVLIAVNKGNAINEIKEKFGIPIKAIVDIEVKDGEVVIKSI